MSMVSIKKIDTLYKKENLENLGKIFKSYKL